METSNYTNQGEISHQSALNSEFRALQQGDEE